PEIKAYPKIGFGYAKKAEALIYIPGLKKPFKISSDKLKIDPLNQDLTFEGNVKVTTSKGMLTTNFLNFNRNRWELSSFDEYTFKTPASTIQGRSLHGSAQKRTLTLFQHHKPTKTLIF
ncbi:MAG: LPS export ABC transporter periplasmic protein LptC, partial [Bacteroidetes bacterium RIFCSPHIGHO2_02_FULL_44_7]